VSDVLRLFASIEPPHEAACAMLKALRALPALPDLRETPPHQVHLTAQFIGDTRAADLDDVIESVNRSCAGLNAFDLAPRRLISLPHAPVARLIACETDAPPALLELHRRLAHRLAHNARERSGDRFLPHFTLARFRRPTHLEPIEADVSIPPFPVASVRLMRSILKPMGAEHVAIHEVTLPSPA
jgi:2'-5' RNA ligase